MTAMEELEARIKRHRQEQAAAGRVISYTKAWEEVEIAYPDLVRAYVEESALRIGVEMHLYRVREKGR